VKDRKFIHAQVKLLCWCKCLFLFRRISRIMD